MAKIMEILPALDGEEMMFVQSIVKEMDDDKARRFAFAYNSRRKDPQLILLTALIGFIGIAGIQRFLLNQIGMGLLYLFTAGICWVGTIIDLVNYKKLALEYNANVAREVVMMMKSTD